MMEHRHSVVQEQLSSNSIQHSGPHSVRKKKQQANNPDPLKLKERKESVLRMLEAIELEEEKLRKKSQQENHLHRPEMARSLLTQEEQTRIKEVWRSHRRLEIRLKKRDEQLRAFYLAEQQHQERLNEEQLEQRRMERRRLTTLKLEELAQKRLEREEFHHRTQEQVKQQLQRHSLEVEMTEKFRRRQDEERRRLHQQRLLKKQALDMSILDLKEH